MMDVLLMALEIEVVPPKQISETSLTMRNEQKVVAIQMETKPIQSVIEVNPVFGQ
jgi:hypothetical protein